MTDFLKKWAPFLVLIVMLSGQWLSVVLLQFSMLDRIARVETLVQEHIRSAFREPERGNIATASAELKYGHPVK